MGLADLTDFLNVVVVVSWLVAGVVEERCATGTWQPFYHPTVASPPRVGVFLRAHACVRVHACCIVCVLYCLGAPACLRLAICISSCSCACLPAFTQRMHGWMDGWMDGCING